MHTGNDNNDASQSPSRHLSGLDTLPGERSFTKGAPDPRCWNQALHTCLMEMGFKISTHYYQLVYVFWLFM